MKKFIQNLLAKKAHAIVQKYQPRVIAITGSVGKTSTRNAVTAVLFKSGRVRKNEENYNNEFGVPLTIIGCMSPGKSLLGWLGVFWKAQRLLWTKDPSYPTILVLEYAIDHPGDMEFLVSIARPHVAVFTALSPVHSEFFKDVDHLFQEKAVLVKSVGADGAVILNADDERVKSLRDEVKANVLTYGFSKDADIQASNYRLETLEDFSFEPGEKFAEIHADVTYKKATYDLAIPHLIGSSQVSAALGGVGVGLATGMSIETALEGLKRILPEPGRMHAIPGIKGSLILDDSYNAAPASVQAALKVLLQFDPVEPARRIAVLGHMAELGALSEQEHRNIGVAVVASKVDVLVTVGEKAQDIRRSAIELGMVESACLHFNTSLEAGRALDRLLKKGDIVLVKGSQSARMEKTVKDIMAEPALSEKLLVRQYGKWLEN